MIQAFKKGILGYLDTVSDTTRCLGFEDMHVRHNKHLPNLRTLYRWHKSLGPLLDHFPSIDFKHIGLIHLHIIIPQALEKWLSLPFCVEALWLCSGTKKRVLYLHCLIPKQWKEDIANMLERKETRKLSPGLTYLFSSEGRQTVNQLHSCIDQTGRIHTPVQEPHRVNIDIYQGDGKPSPVLERYPFIIPIIFEHYGKRISMEKLWIRIIDRLGKKVWSYLPRGTKRRCTNGKGYIRKGYRLMNDYGIFSQNFLRYKPLLTHALEFVLLIHHESLEELQKQISKLVPYTPVVEVYPGTAGTSLIRIIGDSSLCYKLMEFFPDRESGVEWCMMDKIRTWAVKEKVRFRYEEFYNTQTKEWRLSSKSLNQYFHMGGE